VDYSTINGTAVAGSDFVGITNGTLTFAEGERAKQITIPIINDTVSEALETFQVQLSNPTNMPLN
jgi:endoglucanase